MTFCLLFSITIWRL